MNVFRARILIAEPDPDVQQTLRVYFEHRGYATQTVEGAGEVVKVSRPWQPNLILLSTEFTDKDAYRVCQNLMEDTLTGHIPVVMLLRVNERQARLAALEAGASDVIAKPFDLEELLLRVDAAVRLATMQAEV